MAKNILGLDLGVTSIGFAQVIEGETADESVIKLIGARVVPLSIEEQTNFEKGKPITLNRDRTLKRGARRSLCRFKDRRKKLIELLIQSEIISAESKLAEDGKDSTFDTWSIRSKAVTEKITKDDENRRLIQK